MPNQFSELLADRFTRHAVDISRFEGTLKTQTLGLLQDLEGQIAKDLARLDPTATTQTRRRLEALQGAVKRDIQSAYGTIRKEARRSLVELAEIVSDGTIDAINKAAKVSLLNVGLNAETFRAIADDSLIQGAPAREWWSRQAGNLYQRFSTEIREGVYRGEPLQQLTARIIGTKEFDYKNGVMEVTRHNAETLVRTSVQSVHNAARHQTLMANPDVIKGYQTLSVLDDRTTPLCQARSGMSWTLDGKPMDEGTNIDFPGPPPWHYNCRTTLIPVTYSWEELSKNKDLGKKVQAEVDKIPPGTQASMDGQVAGDLNYEQWLKTKPESFQRDILGDQKWQLWQEGKVGLRDLIDQKGRPLSIDQLRERIAPPPPTDGWKPLMTQDEADQWARNSAVPQTLYHITTPEAAELIREQGFRPGAGSLYGRGTYLTTVADAKIAGRGIKLAGEGATLATRLNVRKVFQIPGPVTSPQRFFEALRKMGATQDEMQDGLGFLQRQGYDAVLIKRGAGKPDWYAVTDPRRITVVKPPAVPIEPPGPPPPKPLPDGFKRLEPLKFGKAEVDFIYDPQVIATETAEMARGWIKRIPQRELAKSGARRIEMFENPEDLMRRLEQVGIEVDPGMIGRGAYDFDTKTIYASMWDGEINSARTLLHELGHSIVGVSEELAEGWAQAMLRSILKEGPKPLPKKDLPKPGDAHVSPHSKGLPFYKNDFTDTGKVNARTIEGNRDITELPFAGDTQVQKVIQAAEKASDGWKLEAIDAPTQTVPVKDLVAMQPTVTEATINKYRLHGDANAGKMVAIKVNGKYYIQNGTHRAIARMQKGQTSLEFHVFDLDAKNRPAPKVEPPPKPEPKPKPKPEPKPEPPPWDDRTPGVQWHRAAMPDSPDYVKRAIGRLPSLSSQRTIGADEIKKGSVSHYMPGMREIAMEPHLKPTGATGRAVWRHEYGHHIDAMLGRQEYGYDRMISSSVPWQRAWREDGIRALQNGKGMAPQLIAARQRATMTADEWMGEAKAALRSEGMEGALAKVRGFVEAEGLEWAHWEKFVDTIKTPGVRQLWTQEATLRNHLELLAAYRHSTLSEATLRLFSSGPSMQAAQFMDALGGATKNQIGYGHDLAYYTGRHGETLQGTEVAANVFSALAHHNPMWGKWMERFMPRTTAMMRDALEKLSS